MDEQALLRRITVNPEIFGGKPIIRGMRISVDTILGLMVAGETTDSILRNYPRLEVEDVLACLAYARAMVTNASLEAVEVAAA